MGTAPTATARRWTLRAKNVSITFAPRAWENLFLSCWACNAAKREQWDEALLRPDVSDFRFERYFEYRFDTGEIGPNQAAPEIDQSRARSTIAILDLNRSGACASRRRAVQLMQKVA